jgi:hypothetical protein
MTKPAALTCAYGFQRLIAVSGFRAMSSTLGDATVLAKGVRHVIDAATWHPQSIFDWIRGDLEK